MALSDLDSIQSYLRAQETHGPLQRVICAQHPASTAATVNCGGITGNRSTQTFTPPAVASGLTGWHFTGDITGLRVAPQMAALEINLGSYSSSTNTFTDGSAVGTRDFRIGGVTYNEQMGSQLIACYVSTVHAATALVFTFDYTDQDGNSGTSGTITIPASAAAGSVYILNAHLAAGDYNVRDITSVTETSGPASGVIQFVALFPILRASITGANVPDMIPQFSLPDVPIVVTSSDVISFYSFQGSTDETRIVLRGTAV